jgi:hypothetical protein
MITLAGAKEVTLLASLSTSLPTGSSPKISIKFTKIFKEQKRDFIIILEETYWP